MGRSPIVANLGEPEYLHRKKDYYYSQDYQRRETYPLGQKYAEDYIKADDGPNNEHRLME